MYAIIRESGRQLRVEEGQLVQIDYRDLAKGSPITFDNVLACGAEGSLQIGQPCVAGAAVQAEVVDIVQGPKLVVQKMRRRKNSRRKTGHRQISLQVKINKIVVA
ncbi:MAG: 50S ribosomal protein L21 [Pirellulales bacterium]